ncbi:SHOCT domain-containing protein [Leifsonia sp. 1010]|uniref:SHOCT domain-containing protein n=1 Tax=Leifsonia sp. 1010 TaxID=2817769 RepID=UPI002865B088|nr:SHOCT domain-containing protein [Leifsonia sp. 1010]MDR6610705.1 ABC-type multidrug transport system fused ATPase/permease subunit [Leifsonia sp. 1010]
MTFWDFIVWTFWFYLVVVCISIFIRVIIDVFRDPELNGWAKALWVLFLVILPFLAAFIYLIARGGRMAQRSAAGAMEAQAAATEHIRTVAGTSSPSAEIESAKRLLDSGAITPAEFETLKGKALAGVA